MVKKIIKSLLGLSMVAVMGLSLTACGGDSEQITVITREDGSGTRGAFVEIVDITVNGNDSITTEAVVAPGTSVMMTNVAENPMAIVNFSQRFTVQSDNSKNS